MGIFMLAAGPAAAADVSLTAPAAALMPGEAFSVDVQVSDVVSLYGYQFSLAFDPAVLQLAGVVEGPALGAAPDGYFVAGAIDNALGRLGLTLGTLTGPADGFSGSGPLATLSFAARAGGVSALTLGDTLLVASNGDLIDTRVGSAMVTVLTPVPEPSTAVLLGFGLALGLVAATALRSAEPSSRPGKVRP